MTDAALAQVAERTTVFARTSPAQKTRILLALKKHGHVVGFIGDGINDAPSLHAADVGISVPGAVDVAREAADILLTKQGLDVLHGGIVAGRRAFANVMKYLLMGTSSNFGNMLSMAVSSLILPVPADAARRRSCSTTCSTTSRRSPSRPTTSTRAGRANRTARTSASSGGSWSSSAPSARSSTSSRSSCCSASSTRARRSSRRGGSSSRSARRRSSSS